MKYLGGGVLGILLCLMTPSVVAAENVQHELTLGQAVKEALDANLGLRTEELKTGIKKRDKDLSLNKLYPTISVGAGVTRLNDLSQYEIYPLIGSLAQKNGYPISADDLKFNDTFVIAEFNAQLVISAASILSIQQTGIDYENSLISYDLAKQRLVRDVRKAFFQLLVLQEQIKVTQKRLDNAEHRYNDELNKMKAGQSAELSVLQAQVAWYNLKPTYDDLKVTYSQNLFAFENGLGREPDPNLELTGDLEVQVPGTDPSAEDLIVKYLGKRLDLQLAAGQLKAAQGLQGIQDSQWWPNLILQYKADPALNDPWGKNASNWNSTSKWAQQTGSTTLLLNWKIDSFIPGSSFWNNRGDLDDQKTIAQNALSQQEKAARSEVFTLVNKIRKSTAALKSLTQNVDAAKRSFQLTESAYKSGARSLLEVQDADLQLQIAQLSLLNEKQLLNSSLLDLETALNTSREEIYGK